ncbi:hypothetical protein MNV49_006094 [Pseudohyphozyma bogoriensis]|nr:hypothetical protein MNV49_006094 [Pseudohyphozyma bogoriensis]
MASKPSPLIDLSDLDPFHSPRIFQPQSTPTQRSSTPLPPPPLPSAPVSSNDDPLSSFSSLMSFDPPTGPSSTIAGATSRRPSGSAVAQDQMVHAQEQRRQAVMSDLARDPYAALAVSDEPGVFGDTSGVTIPGRRPSISRRERQRSTSSSFSPPRRLSGLMGQVDQNFFSSSSHHPSIPIVSSPPLDPFHPSSPPLHAAESAFRRTASFSSSPSSPNDTWSDFQSAGAGGGDGLFTPTKEGFDLPPAAAPERRVPSGGGERERDKTVTKSKSLPVRGKEKERPKVEENGKGWKKEWSYDANGDDAVQAIKLLGVRDGVSRALDEDVAEGIRPSLPPRLRISTKWTLLYSLDQHGISIQTMYERMKVGLRGAESGVVLVVKDVNGNVFGAYVNEGLKDSKSYYGDGSCFLWKASAFSSSDFRVGSSVKSFKWTGKNTYLILSESNYLSVGGGDGKYGLWIDGVFEKGFSGKCPCFDNEPLTAREYWEKGAGGADQAKFEVVQFEAWKVSL